MKKEVSSAAGNTKVTASKPQKIVIGKDAIMSSARRGKVEPDK